MRLIELLMETLVFKYRWIALLFQMRLAVSLCVLVSAPAWTAPPQIQDVGLSSNPMPVIEFGSHKREEPERLMQVGVWSWDFGGSYGGSGFSSLLSACHAGVDKIKELQSSCLLSEPPNPPVPCTWETYVDESSQYCAAIRNKRTEYRIYLGVSMVCPGNSMAVGSNCVCNPGFVQDLASNSCIPSTPQFCGASGAQTSNPIVPASQAKIRTETDWQGDGPAALRFTRYYSSTWALDSAESFSPMGKAWRHNHAVSLKLLSTAIGDTAYILTGEGYLRRFYKALNTTSWSAIDNQDVLTQDSSGIWSYQRMDDDATVTFDSAGKLQTVTARNGWIATYTYDSLGQLATVSNGFGPTITFNHHGGTLHSITVPGGQTIEYLYTSQQLSRVTYPDGTYRGFLYEHPQYSALLTGIADETGTRWATFGYDSAGRATQSELAGATDRYLVSYPAADGSIATITDPLGTPRTFGYSIRKGRLAVIAGDKPDGVGQPDAASRMQNALGLIESETDFLGTSTTTSWNATRRVPVSQTQAAGTPQQRTTTTEWHPQWRLPTKVTEAGRQTTYAYNSAGNLLIQSILDTGSNTTRTWNWTYNIQGLVATSTEPNGATTSYQYDSAGNLTSRTNALGKTDTYTHDAAGRTLTHTAPSGQHTQYAYDPRGRLLSQTIGSHTTAMAYLPTGLLHSITQPTGHQITYTYDPAQRLTGWSDNRGASASYTLDAMGNRVQESITQQGEAVWQLARSINSINRVQSITVGSSTTAWGYDANGDLTSEVNGLNQTTGYGLDALRRVQSITNAASATARLSYNALDAVTQAKDYKDVATNYTRDALGNAAQEATPDAGTTQTTYDALGRPTHIVHSTGAGGVQTQALRYDLPGTLYNLPEAPNASQGRLSELRDDEAITRYRRDSLGRIVRKAQLHTSGEQRIVNTSYIPAGQGGAGQVKAISYPSGKQLIHQYDATGQLIALRWNGQPLVSNITWNALGQPTGWQWNGFSGSSNTPLAEVREYNTAGQLTGSALLDLTWDAAGRVSQIKQQHMLPGANQAQQATITSAYSYDAVGRLTASAHSGTTDLTLPAGATLADTLGIDTSGYSYDANGNRTQVYYAKAIPGGTATLQRSYQTASGSNKLSGYTQSYTPAGGTAQTSTVTYSHDATGAITKKGDSYLQYGVDGRIAMVSLSPGPNNTQAISYKYNALGQRIAKVDSRLSTTSPVTQQTVYADDGEGSTVLGSYSSQRSPSSAASAGENDNTEIIYLPTAAGPMPIAAQINGRLYAIDSDHLNTPRRLTNQQGQVVWQWLITGFGEVSPTTGAAGYTQEPNGASYGEEVTFDLRYPGQQWDEETQLSYNLNRYFDRATGRYIQADPIGLAGGWNRFLYVNGNPLNYTDPKGLAIPAAVAACLANPACAATMAGIVITGANACIQTVDWILSKSSPFIPSDPYSPESVDGRRSGLRDALGTGNLDPDSPIPDQGPGRDMGGHGARGRTPHDTGERNVNSHEEHSRRPKGNPNGAPRR